MKIMVRTISLILVILTVLSFVSCAARLEGKYKLEDESALNSNTLVGEFEYNEVYIVGQDLPWTYGWVYEANFNFLFEEDTLTIYFRSTCDNHGDQEDLYNVEKKFIYPYTINVEKGQHYLKPEYESETPERRFLIDFFEDYANNIPLSFDGTTLMIAEKKCKAVGNIPETVSYPVSYEFSGDEAKLVLENRVLDHLISREVFRGTYQIKEDKITFDFEKDYGHKWSGSFDFEEKEESIFIDDVEYEK